MQPLRYALNRWVLPRLGSEPLAIKNLNQKAWPTVAALTSERTYTDQIECVEWEPTNNSDGTDLLEEYARASRPLVLKNYAFPDVGGAWTLEWIKQVAGDTMTKIRVGDYASAPGDPEIVPMQLGEFIDYILGQSAFPQPDRLVDGLGPYLGNAPLSLLDEHLPSPRFLGDAPGTHYWLGSSGSQTPLHCHQHGDFLIQQLVGNRKFVLVPPHEALLVGCLPVNLNICTATFDPFDDDPDRFPGSDHIHSLHAELEPGDALLLPGFWFHAVQIEGSSMSATRSRNSMPAVIGGGPLQPWREPPIGRGW